MSIRFHLSSIVATTLLCVTAQAQQQRQPTGTLSMSSLTAQGFEIRAAANTAGSAAQVFLQKGKDVFVCLVALPLDTPQRETRCAAVN